MLSVTIDAAKNGTRELVAAPGAGKRIYVYGLYACGSAGDGTAIFKSATTALTGTLVLDIDAYPLCWPISKKSSPWLRCAANEALNVTLSANVDLDGVLIYDVVQA